MKGERELWLEKRVEELERERDAMVEEAADEQTRSIKAVLMDEMHDHALTLDADRGSYWAQRAEAAEAKLADAVDGIENRQQEIELQASERAKLEAEAERLRAAGVALAALHGKRCHHDLGECPEMASWLAALAPEVE